MRVFKTASKATVLSGWQAYSNHSRVARQLTCIAIIINDSDVGADARCMNHDKACYRLVERIRG
jgi:hypothetical protein